MGPRRRNPVSTPPIGDPADWRIVPYGDDAVFVETGDPAIVGAATAAIRAAGIGREVLAGWGNLVVTGGRPDELATALRSIEVSAGTAAPRRHVITMRPDGADLDEVAATVAATPGEVLGWFTDVTYRVVCLGFVRGFAYLGGIDPRLALPRRATPRVSVPGGSVAIAGGQAGIYPTTSPGGWHLLGTTEFELFNPQHDPPSPFAPGDEVRFEVIEQ